MTLLVEKAENLRSMSGTYYRDSKSIRAAARWRRIKIILFIIFIMIVRN